ncbi:MscS family membrane protein [Cytobacillus oceanisediminis]|uniref:MscS family membrane protein n=1 Tax=Cytobacillus oceanisediminis TaxID=665099 RepID=A0A2V3A370_9BACI|nr:mechanosensitive ion channel family protein [Cytobacillus oceanisediminis]PWW30169.1 MscS family membrane protein [Cytobacillus oceanisediminis]
MDFINLENTWVRIGISAGILLLFLALRKVFTTYVFKMILSFMQKRKVETAANILIAFEKPVRLLFVIIGLQLALKFFPYDLIADNRETQIFRTLFVLLITWGLFNLSSTITIIFPRLMNKLDIDVDRIVIPFITKIAKLIIVVLGITIIAEEWNYNINGFIAGLGLGGLAFALAAKETVSNFFGGVVIVTEKPFTIGDWIKTPSVEGTVEDITFRSTKIRTFAQALVTVPNSTLANEPIINWSKMGKRQIAFHLGVTYTTPKLKLEKLVRRIEQMLIDHKDIHNDTILVKFDRFNDSSLDIYLYFFTTVTTFAEYLNIKEDVNFRIMDLLEEEGVEVAFPTRTLIVQQDGMAVDEQQDLLKKERLHSHS